MSRNTEMELGNLLFGNSRGEYRVDRDIAEVFWENFGDTPFDYHCYYLKQCEHSTDRGGYENDVFKINPYYWGEEEDIMEEPNFVYKPENIEISWYKYPMRDAFSNVLITERKAAEMFRICRESMEED